MEFFVASVLPACRASGLFILIVTACCASFMIPGLLCFDAQYEYCEKAATTCGGMNITYPFAVGNRGCGLPGFQITCVENSSPSIAIHNRRYTILKFYYDVNGFIIFRNEGCHFLDNPIDISSGNADDIFRISSKTKWNLNVLKCNKSVKEAQIMKCNASIYYSLPWDKPVAGYVGGCSMQQAVVEVGRMKWVSNDTMRDESCRSCEGSGGICGYNVSGLSGGKPFVCHCKDGPRTVKCAAHGRETLSIVIIIGCSFGGLALIAIAVFLTFYAERRRTQSPGSSSSKVEKFLREYAYQMPTRFSLSRLKKITNNFSERLGEGGYGVVYKGKFRNGTLVAVKLLDRQRRTEAQFMNEVATIGHVHHVNLVRLLGYCYESFTSALVYEYMANGSLDKFIFDRKEKGQMLRWAQLYSIALGAARGIAYLHHDCEKRIIHFDIKPHNILLDAEFTTKVCDFGLAKLCAKGEDHVSMTVGRGTPGYVAPEVCDADAGPVTDKSDVYSFGMLLLQIVGGRKNIDWKASHSSQLYFPDWAFKLLNSGKLGMISRGAAGEMEAEEDENEDEEKARRLTKIGLWCIQYRSTDRPCMSRIVQMLEGNPDDVPNPPLPSNILSAAPEEPLLFSTKELSRIEIS